MNQLNNINLIKMVRSILRIPKHKLVKCPECEGSGLDTAHKWPDGSFASCEQCEGQGMNKQYIGDSVYAEFKDNQLIVTTENGLPTDPSNTIIFEPEVWYELRHYVDKYTETLGPFRE